MTQKWLCGCLWLARHRIFCFYLKKKRGQKEKHLSWGWAELSSFHELSRAGATTLSTSCHTHRAPGPAGTVGIFQGLRGRQGTGAILLLPHCSRERLTRTRSKIGSCEGHTSVGQHHRGAFLVNLHFLYIFSHLTKPKRPFKARLLTDSTGRDSSSVK